ncbi:MAG: hypothetical protein GX128_09375 [Bacteroidales bacterium]|jgi:hypothetical protein|nr:hypothetical protein [Bacteroidales bacterium]
MNTINYLFIILYFYIMIELLISKHTEKSEKNCLDRILFSKSLILRIMSMAFVIFDKEPP